MENGEVVELEREIIEEVVGFLKNCIKKRKRADLILQILSGETFLGKMQILLKENLKWKKFGQQETIAVYTRLWVQMVSR